MGQASSANTSPESAPRTESTTSVNIILTDQVFDRIVLDQTTMSSKTHSERRDWGGGARGAYSARALREDAERDPDIDPEPIDNPAVADQESELTKNKNYWKKRLEDLQQTQDKIKQVLEAERERGYKDVEGTLPLKVEGKEGELPCSKDLDVVKSCYSSNDLRPLTCVREVEEFISCLHAKKMEMLTNNKEKEDKDEEDEEIGEKEEKEHKDKEEKEKGVKEKEDKMKEEKEYKQKEEKEVKEKEEKMKEDKEHKQKEEKEKGVKEKEDKKKEDKEKELKIMEDKEKEDKEKERKEKEDKQKENKKKEHKDKEDKEKEDKKKEDKEGEGAVDKKDGKLPSS